MDIKYLGHSSFQIKTKSATVVTDPFDPKMVGLKFPKIDADIVTVSHHHPDHDRTDSITGTPLLIDWPGEFEKQNVRITGYQTFHDKNRGADRGENVMYKIEAEGISILHCGDLGHLLDESFAQALGEAHILMVPVGGFYTIDAQEAVKVVRQIEPSIVIPMHYNHDALNQETFAQVAQLSEFLKQIGAEAAEPQPKLTVKKEDLTEAMKVVVMEISS
jgi:L-ascorbate metabolism protein UlaG (beta-lactamase superfamily)